jgi:hypothetical protein
MANQQRAPRKVRSCMALIQFERSGKPQAGSADAPSATRRQARTIILELSPFRAARSLQTGTRSSAMTLRNY